MLRGLPRPLGAAAAALLLGAAPGAAQYVHGVVTYVHSEGPVSGARVLMMDTTGAVVAGTETGYDGRFSIPVTREGPVTLYVEHPSAWAMVDGPVRASYTENTLVLFHLQPSPLALEGMTVEVEARTLALGRTGFYERRELRPGFFLDPEAVERRAAVVVTDFLRAVPGVVVLESREAGKGSFPVMSYALRNQAGPDLCGPRVVLDGMVIHPGGYGWGAEPLDHLLPASDVAAVEVYRTPTEAPAEFGGALAACGMIVLWSKGGRGGPG